MKIHNKVSAINEGFITEYTLLEYVDSFQLPETLFQRHVTQIAALLADHHVGRLHRGLHCIVCCNLSLFVSVATYINMNLVVLALILARSSLLVS